MGCRTPTARPCAFHGNRFEAFIYHAEHDDIVVARAGPYQVVMIGIGGTKNYTGILAIPARNDFQFDADVAIETGNVIEEAHGEAKQGICLGILGENIGPAGRVRVAQNLPTGRRPVIGQGGSPARGQFSELCGIEVDIDRREKGQT